MKDSLRLVVVVTAVCLISALPVSIAHESRRAHRKGRRAPKLDAILGVQPEGASDPASNAVQVVGMSGTDGTTVYYATDKGYASRCSPPMACAGSIG